MLLEKNYEIQVAKIKDFLSKGFDKLSANELAELEILSLAVANYEEEHFSIPAPKTLAEMIELKMYSMNIDQEELAERMGISSINLSLILSGKQEPDLNFLKQCKRVLQIPADFILDYA